jgi:hypothetical protein
MDVRVEEGGERVLAGGFDRDAVFRDGKRARRAQLRYVAAPDEQVAGFIDAGTGVEDVDAADEQLGGFCGTVGES